MTGRLAVACSTPGAPTLVCGTIQLHDPQPGLPQDWLTVWRLSLARLAIAGHVRELEANGPEATVSEFRGEEGQEGRVHARTSSMREGDGPINARAVDYRAQSDHR